MKKLIFMLMLAVCLVSCRQRDVRSVVVHVPEMQNMACASVIRDTVLAVPGVERSPEIKIDLQKRTVTVTYDSMVTAIKNIESAVADRGFVANGRPADKAARANLPKECGLSAE